MKIDPSRPTIAANPTRRADAGGGFAPIGDDAAPTVASTRATSATIAAQSVLALQGLDDPIAKRARHVRRGKDSLDALDRLQIGLLEGRAPGDARATLGRLLREREATDDPTLNAIMDDIDVRVAVELAKLENAARSV